METKKYITEQEESFSFSFNELESTLDRFLQRDKDEEEESYIEIDLERSRHSGEVELRISFSSLPNSSGEALSVQIPGANHHHNDSQDQLLPSQSFKFPTTHSFSSAMSSGRPSFSHELMTSARSPESEDYGNGSTGREALKPSIMRGKAKLSPAELTASSRSRDVYRRLIGKARNRELVGSRITTSFNGGVTKLLIKFRSGKILSTLMSLIKSYSIFPPRLFRGSHHRRQDTAWKYPRLSNPFQKWMDLINSTYLEDSNSSGSGGHDGYNIPRLEELRVMETIGSRKEGLNDYKLQNKRKNGRMSKSLPGTRTTSPLRSREVLMGKMGAEERDSSVRAAIAHCKRSFGDEIGR